MHVYPVTASNADPAIDFLLEREYRAINLSSYLISRGIPLPPPGQLSFLLALSSRDERVIGLAGLTKNGILLHCLDADGYTHEEKIAILSLLRPFFESAHVRCILGESAGTTLLYSLINAEPTREVDYALMTYEMNDAGSLTDAGTDTPDHPVPSASKPYRCGPDDAEALLPLQEGYEKEEVLPPNEAWLRESCLANLKAALSLQRIWCVTIEGNPVAKGGTNAQGFLWDQIGGVYTKPEFRNRGLANIIVCTIIKESLTLGRHLALFVKNNNQIAKNIYKKTGFSNKCGFRIAYF